MLNKMLNKIVFTVALISSTSAFATSLECTHKGFSNLKMDIELSNSDAELTVTAEEIRSSQSPRVGETLTLTAVPAGSYEWVKYEGQTEKSRNMYFGLKKADLRKGLAQNFDLTVYISDENDVNPAFRAYGMNCSQK